MVVHYIPKHNRQKLWSVNALAISAGLVLVIVAMVGLYQAVTATSREAELDRKAFRPGLRPRVSPIFTSRMVTVLKNECWMRKPDGASFPATRIGAPSPMISGAGRPRMSRLTSSDGSAS